MTDEELREREELRQLTRAAHEAAGDLRRALREAEGKAERLHDQTVDLIIADTDEELRQLIAVRVDKLLDQLSEKTVERIKITERLIEARLVRLVCATIGLPRQIDTLEAFSAALESRTLVPGSEGDRVVRTMFGIGVNRAERRSR